MKNGCIVCDSEPVDAEAENRFAQLSASLLCKKCYAALVRVGDAKRFHSVDDVIRWAATRARRAARKAERLKYV